MQNGGRRAEGVRTQRPNHAVPTAQGKSTLTGLRQLTPGAAATEAHQLPPTLQMASQRLLAMPLPSCLPRTGHGTWKPHTAPNETSLHPSGTQVRPGKVLCKWRTASVYNIPCIHSLNPPNMMHTGTSTISPIFQMGILRQAGSGNVPRVTQVEIATLGSSIGARRLILCTVPLM